MDRTSPFVLEEEETADRELLPEALEESADEARDSAEASDGEAPYESEEHEVEHFDQFVSFDLQAAPGASKPTIGFEFDINVGLSVDVFNARASAMPVGATFPADGDPITDHAWKSGAALADGFEVKRDGPRLEIATVPIEIDDDATFKKVAENILKFVKELEKARSKKSADGTVTVAGISGHPIWFEHPRTVISKLPLVIAARGSSGSEKWPTDKSVWGSPQATVTVLLEHVGELVGEVQKTAGAGKGLALTGDKDKRLGLRSDVVVRAKERVLADRTAQIGMTLSDGSTLTAADFSERLTGLLILMTSYMLAGEMCDSRDYEAFAKAYLPLNVKAPFRDLFHSADTLTDRDRLVFKDVYHVHPENFYGLARRRDVGDGDTRLFLPKTHWDLRRFHTTLPTWEMLLNLTVTNTALKVTKGNSVSKKHHALGDEVLFAPLSSIIALSKTTPRVAIELRRIGYAEHFSSSWTTLMKTVRSLAKKLNP